MSGAAELEDSALYRSTVLHKATAAQVSFWTRCRVLPQVRIRLITARLKTAVCGRRNAPGTITDEHCCLKLPTSNIHVRQNIVPNATNQPCTPEAQVQCHEPQLVNICPTIHDGQDRSSDIPQTFFTETPFLPRVRNSILSWLEAMKQCLNVVCRRTQINNIGTVVRSAVEGY